MLLLLREDSELQQERLLKYTSNLDWELFLELVLHHRVYPLVYINSKKMNFLNMPNEIIKKLQLHYNQNVLKMLRLFGEMNTISKLFTKKRIRLIQLKGPILALQLYGDLSYRTSKDLDILVPIEDLDNCIEVLKQLGYIPDLKLLPSNWKKKSHHLSFRHSLHSVQVEIHWSLNPYHDNVPSFDELWERKNEMLISNQHFYSLGNDDLYLYLVDHGSRHGWFRLRWLVDIERILNSEKYLSEFIKEKNQNNIFSGQALFLASQFFYKEKKFSEAKIILDKKTQKLYDLSMDCIIKGHESDKSIFKRYNRHIYSLMTKKEKITYVINIMLPSSRDIEIFPLPKLPYFLYFPLRPFLWSLRQINTVKKNYKERRLSN